ncbi:hypothetical protein [sulfur-oxidizing endosymbiont of Gigantopelta aegis]|uniref:hypothetical protein n=1 Tax=sulfur-oxidizing endosymbiont of Gigantopelta aegis TaxID=2794934 RepID=UPI0018DE08D7|nr:hypothetical protein [sulfur-oxidizing endosymbiont of Gigantopelta aegis]
MKNYKFILVLVIFIISHSAWSMHSNINMLSPIVIKGEQMEPLLGREIKGIRVYAFKNGKAKVIPFQIDQKDANDNWVWTTVLNSNRHEMQNYDVDDKTGKNIFDSNDQLVFMARDTGQKEQKAATKINSSEVLELKIVLGSSIHPRWIYVSYQATHLSDKSKKYYMKYDHFEQRIKSPVYSMIYSKDHVAVMEKMFLAGQPVMRQAQFTGKVDINFLLFHNTIEFNETEIEGYAVGYIEGPIRIIKQFMTYVNLGLGLKSMSLKVEHLFYPNHTEVPIIIVKSSMVKTMSIKIGAEYSLANLSSVYNDNFDVLSYLEKDSVKNHAADHREHQFLGINNSAFSMLTLLKIPSELVGKINAQTFINTSETIVHNNQVIEEKQLAGFTLTTRESFPEGQYQLKVISIFSDKPDICQKNNVFKEKVIVSTTMI